MKTEDLAASLRKVEADHGVDSVTLRFAVIRAAKLYGRSRYALGKALTLYKQELPHGAWTLAVSLISKRFQLSDRTLREIMSGYRQTLPLPSSVIDELKRAGIDPVSGRGRKVVSILKDADLSTPSQAVDFATRQVSRMSKSVMPEGTVAPTKEELDVYKVRVAVRTALSNVPPNRKLSILNTAIAEEDAIDRDAARSGGTAIIFTCSLSDFFHQQADRWRTDAWRVIRDCRHVRWLILTKRPHRIADHLPSDWGEGWKHVWLGVTVGHRNSYPRLDELRKIPCALRFISAEPLLESIADVNLEGIGWVAAGGMSGPLHRKRRMDLKWALELYRRCQVAKVPFLFKQSSDIHTERGIDGLSRYICDLEGRLHSGPHPLIREYPVTDTPLLPFTERGHRYTDAQWAKQLNQATQPDESSEGGSDLFPVNSITYLAAPV